MIVASGFDLVTDLSVPGVSRGSREARRQGGGHTAPADTAENGGDARFDGKISSQIAQLTRLARRLEQHGYE